ncbi:hypothetical protein [Vibrio furnissii]|uniref:hypothetical protein n=1 Tax=Vibrio furnissii TaxID=29494 RepID=UPI0015597AC0|nr:hypothetical protein [Vibrio furnissii]
MFELKLQHELVQLLTAGASFSISAGLKPQHELVQLATAAKNGGGKLTFIGLTLKPQHELVQLATAGKGAVFFAEE